MVVDIINVADISGMEFPAGRRTRVLGGPDAPLEAENLLKKMDLKHYYRQIKAPNPLL